MADRLERYREMRDFSRTPEPSGNTKKSNGGLHYYIQRHDATRLHYDFRLELDGVLKSWAVPKGPSFNPADKRLAVQTEDHPLDYGEFEGTIPAKQYGAGDVLLWDKGEWTPEDPDPRAALRKGTLHFRLEGEKLRGRWVLTRLRDRKNWLLIKRNDENASEELDIVEERPESVKRAPKKSRRAARAALPAFVTPQLATLVTEPPRSSAATGNWVYEVKHDGYRMLCRVDDEVHLFTRSGNDWTAKLPHLVKAIEKLGLEEAWLDGEIVVPGPDGRSSFQALQNAFEAGADAKIVYYVFDAPFLEGRDLRPLPLAERKQRLEQALKPSAAVRFSDDLQGSAAEVLEHACKLKLEGLIGKQADSVYVAGRSKSWIKLKCRQQQDFVIAGYTAPKGSRHGFGALLLGLYEKPRKLVYAGKVGTGFDDERLSNLTKKFSSLKSKESALENPPREKGITWLRPKLVAQVEFTERTNDGIVRQGSFMGLREDIAPKQVGVEKAESAPAEIRITHPDRLVWPSLKITKADLVRYYAEVAEWMLPHVANRPLTLVRCPDGAEAKCFYQRHLGMGASPGDLKEVERLRSSKGKYLYLDSKNGILSAVQNGSVEFHTWGASLPDIQRPDRITMDLDPGPGVTWGDLVKATQLTRTLLEKLGLKCFLKTTGGKGLHVVAPLEPRLAWDEVKEFTRLVAVFLVRVEPKLFVAEMSKAKRPGRVYVDYLRNAETASAVSAYSARARKEAGVSTPLEWDELGRADLRERFTVLTVPKRLAKLTVDPWAEYPSTRQSITRAMLSALSR